MKFKRLRREAAYAFVTFAIIAVVVFFVDRVA